MADFAAKVMSTSGPTREGPTLAEQVARSDYAARVCEAVACIGSAPDKATVLGLLKQAVIALGADAGVFTSFVRDDTTNSSYRSLLACDPLWGAEYARQGWFSDDPWLHHALCSASAVRASELTPATPTQRTICEAARQFGFASAVIVPAPSAAGHSRIGVLCLGSSIEGHFDSDGYPLFRCLAQGLAMELHHWWHRQIRDELIADLKLTEDDLALLRHEQQGHSSKVVAGALDTLPQTIDCRFQRLSAKLGMANRRAAVRYAELYGLIDPM